MEKMQINSDNPERLFEDAQLREEKGDLAAAFKSHLAAAQLGNVLSQLAVGNFYANGTGVPSSLALAAQWYKKAYRNGVSAAAINLLLSCRTGGTFGERLHGSNEQ